MGRLPLAQLVFLFWIAFGATFIRWLVTSGEVSNPQPQDAYLVCSGFQADNTIDNRRVKHGDLASEIPQHPDAPSARLSTCIHNHLSPIRGTGARQFPNRKLSCPDRRCPDQANRTGAEPDRCLVPIPEAQINSYDWPSI